MKMQLMNETFKQWNYIKKEKLIETKLFIS